MHRKIMATLGLDRESHKISIVYHALQLLMNTQFIVSNLNVIVEAVVFHTSASSQHASRVEEPPSSPLDMYPSVADAMPFPYNTQPCSAVDDLDNTEEAKVLGTTQTHDVGGSSHAYEHVQAYIDEGLDIDASNQIIARPKPKGFLHLQLKTGSNGESKRTMATEKKLSDVEIESDDDYELDEIEEHELDIKLKQLQEEAEALKKKCKRLELEIEEYTASDAYYIESTNSLEQGTEQQQIGNPKTAISVTPVSFFLSGEEQIGRPVTPVNAAKTRCDMLISPSPIPILADQFQFLVPYTQLMMLQCLRILSSLAPAQRLFNSLDHFEKKVIEQLMR
nr:hypothetical protein CFP56_31140 [Quercus suber]